MTRDLGTWHRNTGFWEYGKEGRYVGLEIEIAGEKQKTVRFRREQKGGL